MPRTTILAAALSLVPGIASADNPASLDWELAAVSEYLFRSVSQSDEKPTLQGTLNWTSPVGIYLGTWISGVDFGPGNPKAEVDYYVGYAWNISPAASFDLQLARYTYPGASELAYNELVTTTTLYDTWKIGLLYSNTSVPTFFRTERLDFQRNFYLRLRQSACLPVGYQSQAIDLLEFSRTKSSSESVEFHRGWHAG